MTNKNEGLLGFPCMQPSVHSWLSQPCLLPRQHGEVENSSLTLISSSSRGTGTGENLSPDPCLPFDSMGLEQEQVTAWSPPTRGHSSWGPCHGLELYKSSLLCGMQRHVLGVSIGGGGLLVLGLTNTAYLIWFIEGMVPWGAKFSFTFFFFLILQTESPEGS